MLIKYTYQTKARHTHTQRNDNAQKHAKYSTATYISITCAYLLIKYCTPNDKMLFKVATVVHIDGSKKSFTPSHTHTSLYDIFRGTFSPFWCDGVCVALTQNVDTRLDSSLQPHPFGFGHFAPRLFAQ